MIATLTGRLSAKKTNTIILDVHGVGYEVFISSNTYDELPARDEETFLFIHTNVREDSITLYGFSNPEEKELFLILNSVSGIGPKLALSILSEIDTTDLCEAIRMKDIVRLTSLTGVGKKTAGRLCVELQDKISALSVEYLPHSANQAGIDNKLSINIVQDVVSALVNLGYPQQTAWQALKTVRKNKDGDIDAFSLEELIRETLQVLS